MPEGEAFEHAEERRLLYVALTRARRAVALISHPNRMSPFVVELLKHPQVQATGAEPIEVCPQCGTGAVIQKKGKYGTFLGCSTFPMCDYKRKLSAT